MNISYFLVMQINDNKTKYLYFLILKIFFFNISDIALNHKIAFSETVIILHASL